MKTQLKTTRNYIPRYNFATAPPTTRNYIPRNNFSTASPTTFNPLMASFNPLMTPERRLRKRLLDIVAKQQTLLNKSFSSDSNTSFSYKPSKYITNCFIIMSYLDNKDIFNESIKRFNLSIDKRYTVYIKVRYNLNMFFMVGNQFGFHYISYNSLSQLYDDINIKLLEYLSSYNLTDEYIMYIQISFRLLDKKIFNRLRLIHDENRSISENKRLKTIISIPVFRDIKQLINSGSSIPVTLDSNNKIKEIEVYINGTKINFLDKILEKSNYNASARKSHSDYVTLFDSSYSFVYIKSNIDYILAAKQLSTNSIEILKFSLSGFFISKTVDNFSYNSIIREKGNETIYMNDKNEVTKNIIDIKLNKLKKYNLKYDH